MPRKRPVNFAPINPDGIVRVCTKCSTGKPLCLFTKNKQHTTGWGGECVACANIRTAAYRNANLDKVRTHDRERSKEPERTEYLRNQVYDYRAKNPEKVRAHWKVKQAKKTGRLTPKPCVKCGDAKSAAHHEDYSKPLDVIWLCYSCHKHLHNGTITL